MKTIRQLIRQPLKTLTGCVMIALAVAALIVCYGQTMATEFTEEKLDETFHTVALLTDELQYNEVTVISPDGIEHQTIVPTSTMPKEISAWIEAAEQYTHTVKCIADHGLASAYIPSLAMDNYSDYPSNGHAYISELGLIYPQITNTTSLEPTPYGTPYDCAMLEITLTEIQKGQNGDLWMTGTVNSVISIHEGFSDPTGFTLRTMLRLPDNESAETLGLEAGGRYLVYGTHYFDLDWNLRHEYLTRAFGTKTLIEAFDVDNIRMFSDSTLETYESYGYSQVGWYYHEGEYVIIQDTDLEKMRTAYLHLDSARNYGFSRELVTNTDGTTSIVLTDDCFYYDENGEKVTISREEYLDRYEIPNIVRLDGSAEDFLASPEGALWREVLANMEVNYHAFPVLGVDNLGYVAEFARENARVTSGRDFTQNELESGAKVCIISETVAATSGLQVGDTISLRYYDPDRASPYQNTLEEGFGTVNPAAYRYGSTTPFAGESEEYTIIGLYRCRDPWQSAESDIYAMTPNTVFVPKTSVTGEMSYAKQGGFRTVVLKNGTLSEFIKIADEAGYESLFLYYDQGYSAVEEGIRQYRIVAARATLVGFAVYGIILMIFLVMLPGQQRKITDTMTMLGAKRRDKVIYVLKYSFCILLMGTLLGCLQGSLLWNDVAAALLAAANVTLELELGLQGFAQIALGQLVAAMLLTLCIAIPMTGSKSIMKHK